MSPNPVEEKNGDGLELLGKNVREKRNFKYIGVSLKKNEWLCNKELKRGAIAANRAGKTKKYKFMDKIVKRRWGIVAQKRRLEQMDGE